MGVNCDWYDCDWLTDNRRLIVHNFDNRWTIDELRVSAAHAWDLMRTVDYTVDVVLDVSHANSVPNSFLQLGNRIASQRPTNGGLIVFATRLGFARALGSIFRQIYASRLPRFKFDFADDLPHSLTIIKSYRERHGYYEEQGYIKPIVTQEAKNSPSAPAILQTPQESKDTAPESLPITSTLATDIKDTAPESLPITSTLATDIKDTAPSSSSDTAQNEG